MKKRSQRLFTPNSLRPPFFVYGRLTDTGLLKRLLGRLPHMDLAVLRGMKRVKKKGTAYFTLKADQRGEVAGCLLHGITPEELLILDEYEEVDRGLYKRVFCSVKWTFWVYI